MLASKKLEMTFDELVARAAQPLTPRSSAKKTAYQSLAMEGSSEGPLMNQSICFTGSLGIVRSKAAELVNNLGASVSNGVSANTTILIVGTQNSPAITDNKSSKHKKAEQLIRDGYSIEIWSEDQFLQVLGANPSS